MAMFIRKRSRRVRLANRMGSRRTKILLATAFALIAVASYLVSSDQNTNRANYYVAIGDLSQNSQLNELSVSLVALDLKEHSNRYLQADSKVSEWVLAKPVRAGELIPLSALTDQALSDCAAIKVALGIDLSKSIHRGDLIDLWAGVNGNGIESAPVQIVTAGLVIEIFSATDSLGQSKQEIEICVSPAEIRSVVHSLANQDVIVGVISQ